MPDYQQGKIYKLKNEELVYIGSTTTTLQRRLIQHRCDAKYINLSSKLLFENGENVIIELVENFPCNSKKELLYRERFWVQNTLCINQTLPIRNKHEYQIENAEYFKNCRKEWALKNKDRIFLQRRDHREKIKNYLYEQLPCECGGTAPRKHFTRHQKSKSCIQLRSLLPKTDAPQPVVQTTFEIQT